MPEWPEPLIEKVKGNRSGNPTGDGWRISIGRVGGGLSGRERVSGGGKKGKGEPGLALSR